MSAVSTKLIDFELGSIFTGMRQVNVRRQILDFLREALVKRLLDTRP